MKYYIKSDVFITPGGIFGNAGKNYVSVSLCSTEEKISESIERKRILKNKINPESMFGNVTIVGVGLDQRFLCAWIKRKGTGKNIIGVSRTEASRRKRLNWD